MNLKLREARHAGHRCAQGLDFDDDAAAVTADHLVDAALRGVTFGSLPRILADRGADGRDRRPSAADPRHPRDAGVRAPRRRRPGRLRRRASRDARSPSTRPSRAASRSSARTTPTTRACSPTTWRWRRARGWSAFAAGNGPAIVAPEGAIDGAPGHQSDRLRLSLDRRSDDLGHRDLRDHARRSAAASPPRREPLPEGVAHRQGRRADARSGRGARRRDPRLGRPSRARGWRIVVQLLGAMCDDAGHLRRTAEMAFLVIVIDPKLLMPDGEYPERVSELADAIRSATAERDTDRCGCRSIARRAERRRRMQDGDRSPRRVH